MGSCPTRSFEEDKLKKLLNIPDKYDIGFVVALGYPDENSVEEEFIDSLDQQVDNLGVRHVPKRKLEDIKHCNKFQ